MQSIILRPAWRPRFKTAHPGARARIPTCGQDNGYRSVAYASAQFTALIHQLAIKRALNPPH
jgi:hypothetical protein